MKLQEFVDHVNAVIDESPNNQYGRVAADELVGTTTCYYNKGECSNGTIGCVMGQALRRAGLEGREEEGITDFIGDLVEDKIEWPLARNTGEVRIVLDFLDSIQQVQDQGAPWGVARKQAAWRIKDQFNKDHPLTRYCGARRYP